MREMKDSGARWIGLIPVEWQVDKLIVNDIINFTLT